MFFFEDRIDRYCIELLIDIFSDFIDDFFKFVGDEREEDTKWQFFLHKVFDKSWKEFCDEIESINKSDEVDLGATIKKSHDMLTNFTPT